MAAIAAGVAAFTIVSKFVSSSAEAIAFTERHRTTNPLPTQQATGISPWKIILGLIVYLIIELVAFAAGWETVAVYMSLAAAAAAFVVIVVVALWPARISKILQVGDPSAADNDTDKIMLIKANNDAVLTLWAVMAAAGIPATVALFSDGADQSKGYWISFGLFAGSVGGLVFGWFLTKQLRELYDAVAATKGGIEKPTTSEGERVSDEDRL